MLPVDHGAYLYPVWTVSVHWTACCSGDLLGAPAPGAWLDVRRRRWVLPRPAMMPAVLIGWPALAQEAAA